MKDDMRNVWRYLAEKKRERERSDRRIAYWMLVAALLLASAGLALLTYYVVQL